MPAENKIQVVFEALIGNLQANLDQAKSQLQVSTQQMSNAVNDMASKTVGSFGNMQTAIKSNFTAIESAIGSVTRSLMAFGVILAGGMIFKNIIKETIDWNVEAIKLSKSLGITTESASILNVALGDTYNTMDTFLTGAKMLTRTLKTSEESFKSLGVETRDSQGHFRATDEIMMDVIKRLSEFKAGTDRNIEGQKIYSRAWGEVQGLMRLTPEIFEAARKKAEELGLIVGPDGVSKTKAYRAAMQDAEDVLKALKMRIGETLLPVLTSLGNWFSSIGPDALKIFGGALKGIMTFLEYISLGLTVLWESVKTVFSQIILAVTTTASIIDRIMRGDIKGALAAASAGFVEFGKTGEDWLDRVGKAAESTNERVGKMWGLIPTPGKETAPVAEGEISEGGAKPKKVETGPEISRMQEWETEYAEILVKAMEAQGEWKERSLADEKEYWLSKLTLSKISGTEFDAIQRKIATLDLAEWKACHQEEVELARKAAEERKALDDLQDAQVKAHVDAVLAIKKSELSTEVELGRMTKAQELATLKNYEMEAYNAEMEAYRLKLEKYRDEPVKYQEMLNKIKALEDKHVLDMREIDKQMAIDSKTTWQNILSPIKSAISTSINGMIQGTQTLAQAVGNIGQSIAASFVDRVISHILDAWAEMIAKMIMQWLEMVAIKAVLSFVGFGGGGEVPSAKGGWDISSAQGGYDVPRGIVARLHSREMVLPENLADRIRNMTEPTGKMNNVTFNFKINALDSRDVERVLRDNYSGLNRVLKKVKRDIYNE
jgi:DNA-binding ferritin-like protein (Dps family)